MPTITTLEIKVAEVRRGDLVHLPRSLSWGQVEKIKPLTKNREFTLSFGEDKPMHTVRWNLDREVQVRRSEATLEEKREALVTNLQAAIDKFLPWNVEQKDALEAFWANAAANLAKSGPAYYLTWYAQDYAVEEAQLRWKLDVAKWIERERANGDTPLTTLATGDIIVEAREELKRELLTWYEPGSTSGGSNLNELAKHKAMRKMLNSEFDLTYIRSLVKHIHETDALIAQAETASS